MLDGTTYTVSTGSTDTLLTVIDELRRQVDLAGSNTYVLTLQASVLGNSLRVARVDGAEFTFSFNPPRNVAGQVRGLPVPADVSASGIRWREASFTFRGRPNEGERWIVQLDGQNYVDDVGAGEGDWSTVTQDLLNAIVADTGSDLAPGISGDTIALKQPWPIDPETGLARVPAEGDHYFYAPVNLNTRVDEAVQVDTLHVFNGHSPARDVGRLTEDRLTGLGMGEESIVAGQVIAGGIQYSGLEVVRIELGSGADSLLIESTHAGATYVSTGAGADQVTIESILGHTTVRTDAGDDVIHVGNPDLLVDQISGLLTLDGGADEDTVTLDDSGDSLANSATLTTTTLTGLDMSTVAEVQRVFVQAASGSYRLRTAGYGLGSGLADSAFVTRFAGYAEVTLDYDLDAAGLTTRLRALYGTTDLEVRLTRGEGELTYLVSFVRSLAGRNLDPLEWGDTRGTSLLVSSPDASIDVLTQTIRDGSTTPLRDALQTITVNATGGIFRLGLRLDSLHPDAVSLTRAIPFDASADDLRAALEPLLNPNNLDPDGALPFTDNVAIEKFGDTWHLHFQGAFRRFNVSPLDVDTSALIGTIAFNARTDGLNYYTVEFLTLELGSGSDVVHVQSTGAATVIHGAAGLDIFYVHTIQHETTVNGGSEDDRFFVGSNAVLTHTGGTVNGIGAFLNLYGDSHDRQDRLVVDDTGDSTPNTGRMSATHILGLGMAGGIRYFTLDRLEINLGSGDDRFTILSTHGGEFNDVERALNKQTFVTGGAGRDEFTVGNDGTRTDGIPVGDLAPGVDQINDLLDVDGLAGRDTLNINDRIDSTANVGRQIAGVVTDPTRATRVSDSLIVGLDMAGRIGHYAFELLNVLLGVADDRFTIEFEETAKEETNVLAGPGNDRLVFFDGQSITGRYDGEAGLDDTVDYALWTGSVSVNLTIGRATGIGRGFDGTIRGVENAVGGSSRDILIGDAADNELTGNAENDIIEGRAGDDVLEGGSDDDFMDGGTGDDWYVLVPGSEDRVVDPAGHDTLDFSGALRGIRVNLLSLNGDFQTVDAVGNRLALRGVIEDVVGSAFNDFVQGNDVNNEVWGGDGADELQGGPGDDRLHGGNGADLLRGEGDQDELWGDADADDLRGELGDDVLHGGTGDDLLAAGAGADRLAGDAGNDTLRGESGFDLLIFPTALAGVRVDLTALTSTDGLGGADTLSGIEGAIGTGFDDQLFGDGGANEFRGGAGRDQLEGRGGADVLYGGLDDDTVNGGEGSDLIVWEDGDGSDSLNGGATGNDVVAVRGGSAADHFVIDPHPSGGARIRGLNGVPFTLALTRVALVRIEAGAGDDLVEVLGLAGTLVVRMDVDLGSGNDQFVGAQPGGAASSFVNVPVSVLGGPGNDRFFGGAGVDSFDGGDGFDTADYSRAPAGVVVTFNTTTAADGTVTVTPVPGRARNDGYRRHDTLLWVEELIGSAFADRLTGGNLDDVIRGGDGADKINGGPGHDRLLGEGGVDVINGASDNDQLDGGDGNDTLLGGSGDDQLRGGNGDDILRGAAGSDFYFHEPGNDFIAGGKGDVVDYSGSAGPVTVNLAATNQYGTGTDGTGDVDRLAKMDVIIGSPFNDTLIGDKRPNTFIGGGGDDVIDTGLGNDRVIWRDGDGSDAIELGSGTLDQLDVYTDAVDADDMRIGWEPEGVLTIERRNLTLFRLRGHGIERLLMLTLGGNDTVTIGDGLPVALVTVELGDGNDTLLAATATVPLAVRGGAGDDTLAGGRHKDTLDGGLGFDIVDYSGASGALKATVNGQVKNLALKPDVDATSGFERFIGSPFNDVIAGGRGGDVIEGGDGNDTINGGSGRNELHGGRGNDILRGGPLDDRLFGDEGNDQLFGLGGSDQLDGGAGNDLLDGGRDQVVDFASYQSATVGVTVNLATGQGRDTSDGSIGVDTLVNIDGVIGSRHNDILVGNARDNVFNGSEGDDSIQGGDGNDLFVVEDGHGSDTVDGQGGTNLLKILAANVVVTAPAGVLTVTASGVTLARAAGVQRLEIVTGEGDDTVVIGQLAGSGLVEIHVELGGGNDRLDASGTEVPVTVEAGDGDDVVAGGSGDDTIRGGMGDDDLSGGDGDDHLLGEDGEDVLHGDDDNDHLEGGAGADTLIGGLGDDDLEGGQDNDRYVLAAGNDRITDAQGDADQLDFSGASAAVRVDLALSGRQVLDLAGNSVVLVGGVEDIAGSAFDDDLSGSSAANYISGGAGRDRIDGRGANDTLLGEADDDTLVGGDGDDYVRGGDGNDSITGVAGNDQLFGDAGDDTLEGGDGRDEMVGGTGDDLLSGDGGDDRLSGGDDRDTMSGGEGADELDGGTGDDLVRGDAGDDLLMGWSGDDRVEGGEGNDRIFGDDGEDELFGDAGNDDLDGGADDDILHPGLGVNTVRGGQGTNLVVDLLPPPI